MRKTVLSSETDEAILAWIEKNARHHTDGEKHEWAKGVDSYRADAELTEYRKKIYPKLATQIDVGNISILDLIDLDEGRTSISEWISSNKNLD